MIAGLKLDDYDVSGHVRYEMDAFIDPATESDGQTGPEFSLQSTRFLTQHDGFRTMIGGIQFISNPFTYGGGWCGGDFNLDGATDASDVNLWNNHRSTPAASGHVPEPRHSWLTLGILWAAWARGRRAATRFSSWFENRSDR